VLTQRACAPGCTLHPTSSAEPLVCVMRPGARGSSADVRASLERPGSPRRLQLHRCCGGGTRFPVRASGYDGTAGFPGALAPLGRLSLARTPVTSLSTYATNYFSDGPPVRLRLRPPRSITIVIGKPQR
jgi:hypothetical protein